MSYPYRFGQCTADDAATDQVGYVLLIDTCRSDVQRFVSCPYLEER
jgi:hypothetical protein